MSFLDLSKVWMMTILCPSSLRLRRVPAQLYLMMDEAVSFTEAFIVGILLRNAEAQANPHKFYWNDRYRYTLYHSRRLRLLVIDLGDNVAIPHTA